MDSRLSGILDRQNKQQQRVSVMPYSNRALYHIPPDDLEDCECESETIDNGDCECQTECPCDACASGHAAYVRMCEDCGVQFDSYREGNEDYCGTCLDERCGECGCHYDYCECRSDDDDDGDGEHVHGYSYKPDPNFLRVPHDPDVVPETFFGDGLFFGWELEVATDYSADVARLVYDGAGQQESVLYCKTDSSINGVEIVSHPMTFAWFSKRFDFSVFKGSHEISRNLRWRRPNAGYGLHVHVSRTGFTNDAHALRWLLLIYRNPVSMAKIARRTSDEWCSFRDVKSCIAKAKRIGYTERYSAVNAQNEETFEVRIFKSTWIESEFRAAIEFCHASVTYTRTMTAADALKGGLEFRAFRGWLKGKPEYANLLASLKKDTPKDEG